MAVHVEDRSEGLFLVTINGVSIDVETATEINEEKALELVEEAFKNVEETPEGSLIFAGLKIASIAGDGDESDPRPAILQLCFGRRCLLLSLLDDRPLPNLLAFYLTSPAIKIVGLNIPNKLPCFNPRTIQWEDPWQIADRKKRPSLRKFTTVDALATRLKGIEISRPPIGGEGFERWPLKPEQVANLCVDAYLLCEVGRMLIKGLGPALPL